MHENTTTFGPAFDTLIAEAPLPPLGCGAPIAHRELADGKLDHKHAFSGLPIVDPVMADCCISGILLLYNHLDSSHRISQGVSTRTGSF